ncbi:MAG TPA: RNA methyltransferase [Gammaproteobacteria bacterium]|jgi:TrmH family RNA methyltransferase
MQHVNVILVGTTHPGNIGASARAMKTMGLVNLRLVAPSGFPSAEVTARAAGAGDVLAGARVFATLADAIADCGVVLASSARVRGIPWPEYTPREAAARVLDAARAGTEIALVFGREQSGLSNEELSLCHGMIRIPANPEFSSLNLAAAVQVIAYELNVGSAVADSAAEEGEPGIRRVNAAELEQLHAHLEACMTDIGFMRPEQPRRLMIRLRRLFNRAALDENEYNILRGILAAAQQAARKK